MGKYDKFLICSDLDGTLLNREGRLTQENLDAIKYFCENGGRFCISTGRLPSHLLRYVDKEFFNCPAICCNGACIYDFSKDKILYSRPFENGIGKLLPFILNNADAIVHVTLFTGLTKTDFDRFDRNVYDFIDKNTLPIYKLVMCIDTPENTEALRDKLKENFSNYFNFSRSWSTGLEVLNKDATKGDTVERLKGILHDDYISICVGDFENDLTMIQKADVGCAVENAVPILKEAADEIICSNDGHAIKYIVENICDRHIKA